MKRTLTLTLIVLSGVLAPAGGASASGAANRLFVNGDSLAVGTQPYFPGALPGWSIRTSASISRHAFEGAGVLRAQGSSLARVVFVSLGTNDDPRNVGSFRSSVRSIMSVAGPERCVVWSTIVRPAVAGASYAGYNRVLKAEAAARPNLRVFRWRALLSRHPEWLGPDGVHVTGVGYKVRAREIAKKITACPT
jgi:lysophospholipase L1-like esterase